ncbi:hypothetical protein [Nocardia noduli]|uniref:hypothetical protein n=1 Tax=Nocardia noduli TaxID=2815722 RepID=UPI001C21E538|nr:hypothetical protein [Nocardia noduli]
MLGSDTDADTDAGALDSDDTGAADVVEPEYADPRTGFHSGWARTALPADSWITPNGLCPC